MHEPVDVTLVVDALAPQLGGIGRYTLELARRLGREASIGTLHLFARGRLVTDLVPLLQAAPLPRRTAPKVWLDRRKWHRTAGSTIVHGPNFFLPPEAARGVITVHDLSVFKHPETHPAERRREFDRHFARSLARAAHVITDTETIRRDLIAGHGVAAERVTAVGLGASSLFRPHSTQELEVPLRGLGLTTNAYALCLSTLEPRKRIAELLYAWRDLPRRMREAIPLVLAGSDGWLNEALLEQIAEGVCEGWLRHLRFVPEAQLPALITGATLFLYPSIYEGFGLPALEAMASGVPVIAASRSCLAEVCGNAARYVDPDDIDAFRAVIADSLADDEWRASARQKGFERARAYSWDRCISETAGVYRAVADATLKGRP